MNREQKRLLQRQGQLGPDGAPATRRREQARPVTAPAPQPTRAETANYSLVVLVTLVVMIALIFALDYVFSGLARFLFK